MTREIGETARPLQEMVDRPSLSCMFVVINPGQWSATHLFCLAGLVTTLRKSSQVFFPNYSRDLAKVHGVRISDHISELADKFRTFIHGNLRADNVFFGKGNDSRAVALIDWQVKGIARGHSDKALFLAGGITTRVRRVIEYPVIVEPAESCAARSCRRDFRGPPAAYRNRLETDNFGHRRSQCSRTLAGAASSLQLVEKVPDILTGRRCGS